ncbi:hypothetical protein CHGG_08494 [Chaetomium globosum CBS 148.51]|uniref:Uncharacterized protein n=1 Tax=Chaetomium globosum (strain ATCC 6205 / CBS 148.51 / DSM 1962 / NBRC 6347 / NRRL 1970) TaxID=306901 RepID=Q2GU60_CHAGB|nr:uncharacterized protein CHGG_08494 [Chaetomium globosum CBS 148.51]EAQ84480.1 hypothetical protein CHGG_08494 [Chaetomium globosum CBS 148.51]
MATAEDQGDQRPYSIQQSWTIFCSTPIAGQQEKYGNLTQSYRFLDYHYWGAKESGKYPKSIAAVAPAA